MDIPVSIVAFKISLRRYNKGLAAAVARLKHRGVKVSMDPNFDAAGEWTPAAMLSIIKGPSAVDVLMPSEVEARPGIP